MAKLADEIIQTGMKPWPWQQQIYLPEMDPLEDMGLTQAPPSVASGNEGNADRDERARYRIIRQKMGPRVFLGYISRLFLDCELIFVGRD